MENATKKKLVKSKSGLRIVSADDISVSPFTLCEPRWIPDKEISYCPDCKSKFDFIRRKHHCRRCGNIYCSSCTRTRMGLPRMCFVDPVRLCKPCASITDKENDFFERQLKTLVNGATFLLENIATNNISDPLYVICKLSPDHRQLLFEGHEVKKPEPLNLSEIKSLGVGTDEDTGPTSVDIVYSRSNSEECDGRMKLQCGPESYRKLAMQWIIALQQAFKLLYQWPTVGDR